MPHSAQFDSFLPKSSNVRERWRKETISMASTEITPYAKPTRLTVFVGRHPAQVGCKLWRRLECPIEGAVEGAAGQDGYEVAAVLGSAAHVRDRLAG